MINIYHMFNIILPKTLWNLCQIFVKDSSKIWQRFHKVFQQIQFWHILTEWSILGKTRLNMELPQKSLSNSSYLQRKCWLKNKKIFLPPTISHFKEFICFWNALSFRSYLTLTLCGCPESIFIHQRSLPVTTMALTVHGSCVFVACVFSVWIPSQSDQTKELWYPEGSSSDSDICGGYQGFLTFVLQWESMRNFFFISGWRVLLKMKWWQVYGWSVNKNSNQQLWITY